MKPTRPTLDTKTGKVYPSLSSAGQHVAIELGLDSRNTFICYTIQRKYPGRLVDVPKPSKLDELIKFLESQEPGGDFEEIGAIQLDTKSDPNRAYLMVNSRQVGFAFDKTGQKFLGMFNWKD